MGFLKDFAVGFATGKAQQYESEQKIKDEEDLHRKKSLIDLDIKKQELDYKAKKEDEIRKELEKAYEEERQNRLAGETSQIFTPGSAQPTPPSPFNMAPDTSGTGIDFNEAQSWREQQAKAQYLGDEDRAKYAKTQADIADERIKMSDRQREIERQDILSKDGVSILKISAEERAKKYKEGQIESEYGRGTIFKNTTDDKAKFTAELADDALNDELKGIVASNLTNEVTGKLTIDSGTFNRFTKDSIRLTNDISSATSPEEKEQAILELMDLKADMNAQQTGLGDIIMEALTARGKQIPELSGSINQEQPAAEPVKLSTDVMSDMPAASEHTGRIIKDQTTGQRFKSDGTKWNPI